MPPNICKTLNDLWVVMPVVSLCLSPCCYFETRKSQFRAKPTVSRGAGRSTRLASPGEESWQLDVIGLVPEKQAKRFDGHLAERQACLETLSGLRTEEPFVETLRAAEAKPPPDHSPGRIKPAFPA